MKSTYMPDTLTQASLAEMASFEGPPCLSFYQPTHRRHPDNQQDPIRFRNLVQLLDLESHTTVSSYGDIAGGHMAMHHGQAHALSYRRGGKLSSLTRRRRSSHDGSAVHCLCLELHERTP